MIKTRVWFHGGGSTIVDIPDGTRLEKNILISEAANPSSKDQIKLDLTIAMQEIYLPAFQELIDRLIASGLMRWADINSIYRTKSFNNACGGASNSSHLFGGAMDLSWSRKGWTGSKTDATRKKVANIWEEICKERCIAAGYIIYYTGGFHFDVTGKKFTIYDYRNTSKDWRG